MSPRYTIPRASYVPAGAIKIADKQSSAVAYVYSKVSKETGASVPLAVLFHGKADKPDSHFRYRDEARREAAVKEHFANIRAHEKRRADDREKRKAFVHSAKVGDIYRTSWGYDQTNVEFFQIVEIRGKYAVLREIADASEYRGSACDSVVAQSSAFLEPRYEGDDRGLPIRRLIQDGHIKIDDVRTAWPWGTRGPGGIVIGKAVHRTAYGWGH